MSFFVQRRRVKRWFLERDPNSVLLVVGSTSLFVGVACFDWRVALIIAGALLLGLLFWRVK